MINWVLVAIVPFTTVIGGEIGRRRQERAGKTVSFLPIWTHRLLTFFVELTLILFFESAWASLKYPGPFHLWLLILSGAASQIGLITISAAELSYARKRLNA